MTCIVRLAWARLTLLYAADIASTERLKEVEKDADLWDKFVLSFNWLAENSKGQLFTEETSDLLAQIQTTLSQNLSTSIPKIDAVGLVERRSEERYEDFEEY